MSQNRGMLLLTQAGSLRAFADLAHELERTGRAQRVGFYVTDSRMFDRFARARPNFGHGADIVKEWEILYAARRKSIDRGRIAELERRYGESLWNAVVADRRLYFGGKAAWEQDYATRYSHEELLSIMLCAAEAIEALFDRVRPDLVLGFICVTVGEYLANLIARHRGITSLNLRPTRIRNYFYGGEDVFEPSAALETAYRRILQDGISPDALATARDILATVRTSHAMYEGVVPAKRQVAEGKVSKATAAREPLGARLNRIVRESWSYTFGALSADNHHPDRLAAHWFNRVKKPYRRQAMRHVLDRHYVRDLAALGKSGYAFFPLHKEPEVTLLVYGRSWLNQIEAIRAVARNLPSDMTLLVKEHPAALGYRPLSYYRKLLEIPNVKLAAPELTSREVLAHARLVTIIGGSIGLEAIMLKLPVLCLANVPFSFLPDGMIRANREPDRIGEDVNKLLSEHQHDERALEAYVAAVTESSVAVDFYSVLLARGGAIYRPDGAAANSYDEQIARLARFVGDRATTLSALSNSDASASKVLSRYA